MERRRDLAGQHGQFTLHTHTSAELFCFLSGSAVFYIEGSGYRLSPGDILLMRPAEAHYIETDQSLPYERIIVNFDTRAFASLDPESTLLRPYYDRKAGKRNLYRAADFGEQEPAACLMRMLASGERLVILAELILLLQQIGSLFDRETDALPDTIEYRIIRHINKHLDQELSIQELCERFYISRAQLCRRFQKATGTSVGRYVTAKRLIAARQLLLDGEKPTEIYTACGYRDYSTFYRAYCQTFGHSPREEADHQRPHTDRIEIL